MQKLPSRTIVLGVVMSVVSCSPAFAMWNFASPQPNQTFRKYATISGAGMASTTEAFTAEIIIAGVTENSATGTSNMMMWSASLSPPAGTTWTVSTNAKFKVIPALSSAIEQQIEIVN